MAGKCKKCTGVSGIEDAPWAMIGSAVGAALVLDKVNAALTSNPDGTPKTTGYLVENPKIKDAGFVVAGVAATMYADGNAMVLGFGIGAAVFGGYNLAKGFMNQAASGLGYIPPANINGHVRNVPGNYGFQPGILGYQNRTVIPNFQQQQMQQQMQQQQQPEAESMVSAGM